eukprot:Blabericola_migrator_1__181@NODE_104_length_14270_cov_182_757446_g92_i0_p1_GENE_NODE_104_length_14270_cov_182_757446_g92_i0NODE_104_length_14270_cov_182_757446_g92_i0_p1_ORF_typecomplete_len1469_score313_91Filamin/PF00630_19/9_3e11Filamin/PF00630_19/17_NODE_104_length_14270_cov_182_757446_g92_i046619067
METGVLSIASTGLVTARLLSVSIALHLLFVNRCVQLYIDHLEIWSLADDPERTVFFSDALYSVIVSPWTVSPALIFSYFQSQWFSGTLGRVCTYPRELLPMSTFSLHTIIVPAIYDAHNIRRVSIEPKQILVVLGASPTTSVLYVYLCRIIRTPGEDVAPDTRLTRSYKIMQSQSVGFECIAVGDLRLKDEGSATRSNSYVINMQFITTKDSNVTQALLPHSARIQCMANLESIAWDANHSDAVPSKIPSLRSCPALIEALLGIKRLLRRLVIQLRHLELASNICPTDIQGRRVTTQEELRKIPMSVGFFWYDELLENLFERPKDVCYLKQLFGDRFQEMAHNMGIIAIDEKSVLDVQTTKLAGSFAPDQRIELLAPPGNRHLRLLLVLAASDSIIGWSYCNLGEHVDRQPDACPILRTNEPLTFKIFRSLSHSLETGENGPVQLQVSGHEALGTLEVKFDTEPGYDKEIPDLHPERDMEWLLRLKRSMEAESKLFGPDLVFPILDKLKIFHGTSRQERGTLTRIWAAVPPLFKIQSVLQAGMPLMQEMPGLYCFLKRDSPCLTNSSHDSSEYTATVHTSDLDDTHLPQAVEPESAPVNLDDKIYTIQTSDVVSAAHCSLQGPGLNGGRVGEILHFILHARNSQNEDVKRGGARIHLYFILKHSKFPSGTTRSRFQYSRQTDQFVNTNYTADLTKYVHRDAEDKSIWWQIEDPGTGKYSIVAKSLRSGSYDMEVMVDGLPVAGSPFKIVFRSGVIDPQASELIGMEGRSLSTATLDATLMKEIAACLLYWKCNKDSTSGFLNDVVGIHVRDLIFGDNILNQFISEFWKYGVTQRNWFRVQLRDFAGGKLDCRNYSIEVALSSKAQIEKYDINREEGGTLDVEFSIPLNREDLMYMLTLIPEDRLASFDKAKDNTELDNYVPEDLRAVLVDVKVEGASIGSTPLRVGISNLGDLCVWFRKISPWLEVVKPMLPELVLQRLEDSSSKPSASDLEVVMKELKTFNENKLVNCSPKEKILKMQEAWEAISKLRTALKTGRGVKTIENNVSPPAVMLRALITVEVEYLRQRAKHWNLTQKMMTQGQAALEHMRATLAKMGELKTRNLRKLVDRVESGAIETIGDAVNIFAEMGEEMEKLYRPEFNKVAADHMMRYLEMNELALLEAAAKWREARLQQREKMVNQLESNLNRIWNNFTESVIQFPPKETTMEDCMGLSDDAAMLAPRTDSDRENLVRALKEKREAANALREELNQIWSKDKLEDGSLVASMSDAEALIANIGAKFLTQESTGAKSSIILNRGVQSKDTMEAQTLNQSPVGALLLKRRLRCERENTQQTMEDTSAASLILGATKAACRKVTWPELKGLRAILQSSPNLRMMINALYNHYSTKPGQLLPDTNAVVTKGWPGGILIGQYWVLLGDLRLPTWWTGQKFDKFGFIDRSTKVSRRFLPRSLWTRWLEEVGFCSWSPPIPR